MGVRRSPDDAAALLEQSCTWLSRREYSVHEIRRKLQDRASPGLCDQVVQSLLDQGALSDDRFAESLCRSRYNAGKGPLRILVELKRHHIAVQTIERVMEPYESLWRERVEEIRTRKFGSGIPADPGGWMKQIRFLKQRGFRDSETEQYRRLFYG